MNEITIVPRRSRLLPILLTILLIVLLVLAGLWMLGMLPGVPPPSFATALPINGNGGPAALRPA